MLKVRICENTERPLQLNEYEKFIKEVLAVQERKAVLEIAPVRLRIMKKKPTD
jgi:hypothetical protein